MLPRREGFGHRLLHRCWIELASDVDVGAGSSKIILVELLDLLDGVSLNHLFCGENAAIRMIRIQLFHELFARDWLWL